MLGAQLARRDAADHVHLVRLGRGHEQIRLGSPGFPQSLRIGGAALDADHVQLVGNLVDQFGVAVDERDVVTLFGQNRGHRAADLAGAGDDDFHGCIPLLLIRSVCF